MKTNRQPARNRNRRTLLAGSFLLLGVVISVPAQTNDSVVQWEADIAGLSLLTPEAIPTSGTFWVVTSPVGGNGGLTPPYPCLPTNLNYGDIYRLPDGTMLVDAATNDGEDTVQLATQINAVSNVIQRAETVAQAQSASPMRTLLVGGPPFPGGTNSGTNVFIPNNEAYPPPDYGTNLYISQWSLSNNVITGIASNTLPEVEYQLQEEPDLTQSNGWINVGDPIVGSETTNWTPLNPVAVDFTTNWFYRLQSEQSSDGTGIPDWWETEYGLTGVDPNAFDAAGDGWTIYQKYIMGENPGAWVTPPAPQGLTATYDAGTGTATISWLPSPGNVTGYVLTTPSGPVTLSATATSYADTDPNLATYMNPSVFDYVNSTQFQLEASYAGGNSAPSGINLVTAIPDIRLVQGAQGASYLALAPAALPPGTTAIRFARLDVWAEEFYQDDSFDVSNDIPLSAFTNGLYQLPLAWTTDVPPMDSHGYATYDWVAQTVNAAGGANSQAIPVAMEGNVWPLPPYYDGRVQMQQNLIFQLRAASESQPFQFADYEANDVYPIGSSGAIGLYYWDTNTRQEEDSTEASLFTSPANCGYASLWLPDAGATWTDANGLTHAILTLDASAPFEMNARYRNFVFDSAALDASGLLATASADAGIAPYSGYYSFALYPLELYDPVYEFDPTNFDPAVSLLATNQTRWLFAQWENNSTVYGDGSDTSITVAGANYVMAGNARNLFGLPYLSAEIAQTNGGGVTLATLNAGDSLPAGGYLYPEVAQPQLQTAEYDFWNAGYYYDSNGNYLPWDLLPGMDNFSPTNQTDNALVVGLGNSIQIAGYAKESVLNGYTGAYGYLGQYFDQAYEIDTNVTTTPTGVLSPYGTFFPTQPGPVALVTLPDLDTGERGTGVVNVISLTVDKNHDGTMDTSFSGADATSQANPMECWVNDGYILPGSNGNLDKDLPVPPNSPNYLAGQITCPRDLENCFRLWVCGVPTLTNGYSATLTCNVLSGSPAINVYAAETNGGTLYLTDTNVAQGLVNEFAMGTAGVTASGSGTCVFPNGFFDGSNKYLLFEGAGSGEGQFTLTLYQGSTAVAQTSVYIDLHDIKDFYERAEITGMPSSYPAMVDSTNATTFVSNHELPSNPMETNQMIVFVHGWRIGFWDYQSFSDTMFKRLYWAGYQGRFAALRWPTLSSDEYSYLYFNSLADYASKTTYNRSEYVAHRSADGTSAYLDWLKARLPDYSINVAAHSMGNVVMMETLKQQLAEGSHAIDNYVMMQAAIPAQCYDPTLPDYSLFTDAEASSPTPDVYRGFPGNVAAAVNGNIVNFFNTNDFALATGTEPIIGSVSWEGNEVNFKPDGVWGYGYDGTNCYEVNPTYRAVTDPREQMAFVARPRSKAAGALGGVGGQVNGGEVDLFSTYHFYNAEQDHSAEFNWNIQQLGSMTNGFYKTLLNNLFPPQ